VASITACGAPTTFAGFEHNVGQGGGAGIFGEVACYAGSGDAAADDHNVSGAGKGGGGAVAEEKLVRLGVPKGGAAVRAREA